MERDYDSKLTRKKSFSLIADLSKTEEEGRFTREMRLIQNGCPLCDFVQGELERTGSVPIEEWIYLIHMKKAHGIEP